MRKEIGSETQNDFVDHGLWFWAVARRSPAGPSQTSAVRESMDMLPLPASTYNGDVVGVARLSGDTDQHAALWRNGTAYNLGGLGTLPRRAGTGYQRCGIIAGRVYD